MTHTLIIALLLLTGQQAYCQQKQGHAMRPISKGIGQQEVIGHAQVEVMYALNATDIKDKNTYIDLHVLRAGKDVCKHYSRFVELNDSLCDDFNKRNPNARSRPRVFCSDGRNSAYWSEYQFTDIYTENGQHTLYARMPSYMERYNAYYTESAQSQKWTLHEEHYTILGRDCQRATCHWRGRDFEAWFAADIPVHLGPWIFGGLPGLIMKINDKDKLYTWEAVAVEKGSFPIYQLEERFFKDTERKKVWKAQREWNVKYNELSGRMTLDGRLLTKRYPYDQLELE